MHRISIYDHTEAHEQGSAAQALVTLREKAEQFYRGEETLEVVQMYQSAAHDLGCPVLAIRATLLSAKAHVMGTNTLHNQ